MDRGGRHHHRRRQRSVRLAFYRHRRQAGRAHRRQRGVPAPRPDRDRQRRLQHDRRRPAGRPAWRRFGVHLQFGGGAAGACACTVAYDRAVQWDYAPGAVVPMAQRRGGKRWYVVSDHIGTPRELLDETGEVAWSSQPEVWGRQRLWRRNAANDDAVDCPIRFPGQYFDAESGLHYNRHRYYDPDTGQYLSPDPLGLEGGTRPQGYVENPQSWIDPLGLISCSGNAKILRDNMAREGRIVGPNEAAGHIVASGGSQGHWAPAVQSRALLDKYSIGINDAANGIAVGQPNPHGRMHTGDYHQNVLNRLQGVEAQMQQQGYGRKAIRSALRRELRAIGREPL